MAVMAMMVVMGDDLIETNERKKKCEMMYQMIMMIMTMAMAMMVAILCQNS